MIRTTDFSALTDDLQEIFNEVAKTSVAESFGLSLFDAKNTDRKTYDYVVLHGLDVVKKVAEGSDLPTTTLVQSDTATWTQSRYGGIVAITKDMRMFDLYDQIETIVRSASEDAFQKIDQSLADVLLNGFATTSYLDPYGESVSASGVDAVALFSASHTNNINSNVFRNKIYYSTENPILSREAVVATQQRGWKHKDPTGHNRPVNLDTLLVGPALYDEALRIVNSDKISGSAENDVNPLKGRVTVKMWEKLDTNSAGNDCSAYWFLYDSKKVKNSLKCLFAERPSLDAPEQVYKSKNWDYSLDYYYAIGRAYPAYIWGSNGSGA
jgi:hypothetical protein